MARRSIWLLSVGTLLIVVAVLVGPAIYRRIGIATAPKKQAITSRGTAAIAADSVFWQTFHGGKYDQLAGTIEILTRAYLATPNDAVTAAHLGWLHMWRVSERGRLDSAHATITDDMILARRYFDEAVKLNPHDPRTLGFLASALMAEGAIEGDERIVRQGYFTMRDGIKAWPEFNLFTGGYVLSASPTNSAQFRQGVEWQWRDLDACVREHVDRVHPDFSKYMSQATTEGPARACWNSWIAPHNFEGFFLNMGDMLVKAGDWQTAQQLYANARLSPTYAAWQYRLTLEDRIRNAEGNVRRFNGADADLKTGLMINSVFSCMACHQQ